MLYPYYVMLWGTFGGMCPSSSPSNPIHSLPFFLHPPTTVPQPHVPADTFPYASRNIVHDGPYDPGTLAPFLLPLSQPFSKRNTFDNHSQPPVPVRLDPISTTLKLAYRMKDANRVFCVGTQDVVWKGLKEVPETCGRGRMGHARCGPGEGEEGVANAFCTYVNGRGS